MASPESNTTSRAENKHQIAPTPTYHPLSAEREQAEVQKDGQAYAEDDADHCPE